MLPDSCPRNNYKFSFSTTTIPQSFKWTKEPLREQNFPMKCEGKKETTTSRSVFWNKNGLKALLAMKKVKKNIVSVEK